jgi:hypothetical protein
MCSGRIFLKTPLYFPHLFTLCLVSNTGAPRYSHTFCLSWRYAFSYLI